MAYCSLDEVKAELNITDESNDDLLQSSIEQAKEFIDMLCNREFNTVAETRYYDGCGSPLIIDDTVSVTGTSDGIWLDEDADGVHESTMATTDYILYPLNKTPKTQVKLSNDSDFGGFASGVRKGVKITATWGYDSTIPEPIRRASIIQVCRWFKRKDSAFEDVTGNPITGQMYVHKGLDPDVAEICRQYRRWRY